MSADSSVKFFDDQFKRQVAAGDYALNPFELAALPHLSGDVLDYGCGLGNLAVEAARRGCKVTAMDASHTAIEHLRHVAAHEAIDLRVVEADLRQYEIDGDYDAIVCIGLLMFFDCPSAFRQLMALQQRVRPGGIAVVNVLTEDTTFMDMFSPEGHCLFKRDELRTRFAGWSIISYLQQQFGAPHGTLKAFATVIARKTHEA